MGDVRMISADKIRVLNKHTILAAAGHSNAILKMERFFTQLDWESKLDEKPSLSKEQGFDAILIYKGEPYIIYNDGLPDRLRNPFVSCGSGWKFAMAAMHFGMSAVEAVKLASELDVYTNDKIRYLNVAEVFAAKETTKAARGRKKQGPVLRQETEDRTTTDS